MSETLYPISVEVNGVQRTAQVPARLSLVDWLREEMRLTGTHLGCEHGICGACSIMLDGEPVRSCLMYAVQANGHRVTSVCTVWCATRSSNGVSVELRWYASHALRRVRSARRPRKAAASSAS